MHRFLGSEMFKLVLLFPALVLATLFLESSGSVDPVYAQCNPNRPNDLFPYHSGWQRYPGGTAVGGVYAQILNYDAYVAYSFFEEGVVTRVSLDASGLWAQIGWLDLSTGSRRTYTEWVDLQGFVHVNHFSAPPEPQPVGTYGYYTVLYNNYAPGYITMYSAGRLTQILRPVDFGGWLPVYASVFAKTNTRASQMPGGYNAPQFMKNTDIWYDGSWKPFSGTMSVGDPSIHGGLPFGPRAVYVWDKACGI